MIEEITWTKEYKLERYHKLNLTAEKGCVLFAGSSLMEMFPVEKFAHEDGLPVTVYNLSLIHISSPRDLSTSRMPSSA